MQLFVGDDWGKDVRKATRLIALWEDACAGVRVSLHRGHQRMVCLALSRDADVSVNPSKAAVGVSAQHGVAPVEVDQVERQYPPGATRCCRHTTQFRGSRPMRWVRATTVQMH